MLDGDDAVMSATARSHVRSVLWVPAAARLRRGAHTGWCRGFLVGGLALVVLATGCRETTSERPESATPTGPASSLTLEPSPSTPPIVIRLAVTARKYQQVVTRYLTFYDDLSRLSTAFRLLKPMERAFEMWVRAARASIDEQAVQIPPDALQHWAAAFRQWLGNQAAQRDALVECADGQPITEITLIECLDTIGPLVHRGEELSSRLAALLDSEPNLASALPKMRF